MLPFVVKPRKDNGLHNVVDALGQQLRVNRTYAAADDFNVDGRRNGEVGSDDDGA